MSKFTDELDYLVQSLNVVELGHKTTLADLKEAKRDMATLKEDMKVITTPRLQQAASKTHNHFNAERIRLQEKIKAIREDQKWINRLIKIVQEYRRLKK